MLSAFKHTGRGPTMLGVSMGWWLTPVTMAWYMSIFCGELV